MSMFEYFPGSFLILFFGTGMGLNIHLSIYIYFYAVKVIQVIVCATWLGSTEVNITPFALVIVLDYSVLRKLNGHCWPMLHGPSMQTNA